jgi:hypothetical protein
MQEMIKMDASCNAIAHRQVHPTALASSMRANDGTP